MAEATGSLSDQPVPTPFVGANEFERLATEELWDRVLGVVVGSAVGDALGAPFEFDVPGAFSARFPDDKAQEMCGGNGWEPGEFTDDTQMAILEARSIVAVGEIDEIDLFRRFRSWLRTDPRGVGGLTRSVLSDDGGWPTAVQRYCQQRPDRCSGNGSVMRASFAAARWAFANTPGTAEVARRLSVVTHGDPAACEGRALYHLLVHNAVRSGDLMATTVLGEHLDLVASALGCLKDDQVDTYRRMVGPDPDPTIPNGTAMGCLRDAFRSARAGRSFEDCLRLACDVGGDVDTVAAVTGGLAGGLYGLSDIPKRWVDGVHGTVNGERYDAERLIELARAVMAVREPEYPRSIGWRPEQTAVRYGFDQYFTESGVYGERLRQVRQAQSIRRSRRR